MAAVFRLRSYTEIISAMFDSIRSSLGPGVDLNRGSVIRSMLEAAALNDADQYVQISLLLDLFSPDSSHGEDLDRRMLDFGSFFNEDLQRFGSLTSVGDISVGDTAYPIASGTLGAPTSVGDLVFSVNQSAAPNDFATIAGGSVFTVRIGRPELGQEESVLISLATDTMTILSPATGLVFPHQSADPVRFVAITSQLAASMLAGAVSTTVTTGTGALFPVASKIIFDRDVAGLREIKTINSQVGDVIGWAGGTAFGHASGAIVMRSTTGSDRAISAGLSVFVPIGFGTPQINFLTTATGTLLDGDRASAPIPIESKVSGGGTIVAANTITEFQTKPFGTATVNNATATIRGRDREADTDYLPRGKALLQSLSRGTRTALETRTIGLTDPATQSTVAFAEDVEPVGFGVSSLYITDGTTNNLSVTVASTGREVLIAKARAGDRRARIQGSAPYAITTTPLANVTPRIFKSMDRGNALAVGVNSITDVTHAAFTGADIGRWVKTIDNLFFQITGAAGFTLTLNAGGATPAAGVFAMFDFSLNPLAPSTNNPIDVGSDYAFDPTTGDLELSLANALVANDSLVAVDDNDPIIPKSKYRQSTGLVAFVQKVVNGDKNDAQNFPGIKAAGTQVYVLSPIVVYVDVSLLITPAPGFTVVQLSDTISATVQTTVGKLGIGQALVLSDIIVSVRAITGVQDVQITDPTANPTALAGQMIRTLPGNVTVS